MTRAGRPSAPPDVPGLAARRVAAEAVAAALGRLCTLDDALGSGGGRDDALARAIAVTTFRRFGTIRSALAARVAKSLPADADAFAILLTGAAQILFLDVPDHAAVDLAVRLAQSRARTRHLGPLVNALLRRVGRERDAILAEAEDPARDLPEWLAARWSRVYGPGRTAAIAAAHRAGAALDLTCRQDPAGWAARLGGTLLPTGSVRILDRTAVHLLPGFDEGGWWVQDAASSLPARLLDPRPGTRILDLCAAPGGKTAQLAASGARVTALDRSAPRLARLRGNLERLRLEAEIVCRDALEYRSEPFDAVLLDAPCTATGTIRRHPDIAWTKDESDLAKLADLQARLLDKAAGLVRPGGRLVYCVCSLEPEEGEDQAAAFLARAPGFARVPIEAGRDGIGPELLTGAGDLRTAPDLLPPDPAGPSDARGGMDGFYAAVLVRRPG